MEWKGNTLYVATYQGVERFSLAGVSLGVFGDASRISAATGASLSWPRDIAFGTDGRMYVADRSNNRVAYYSAATGAYPGEISSSSSSFTTSRAVGLEWAGSLYQSGGDPGQVNKINPSTRTLGTRFSGDPIDEPQGMYSAPDGRVYVANKDGDRVAVIPSTGVTIGTLSPARLDDPRDVTVGSRYVPPASTGAAGASGAAGTVDTPNANLEPELEVLVAGTPAPSVIDLPVSTTPAIISLHAMDAERDAVAFSVRVVDGAGGLPSDGFVSPLVLVDHGNRTATVAMDRSAAGEHVVEFEAADAHGEEWDMYVIRIVPIAAGTSE